MPTSHRQIIREAVAHLGMSASNRRIRAWARQHHNIELRNNEIINAVGSQRQRTEQGRTVKQMASVASLVTQCDGSHELALNLVRLDRVQCRETPDKKGRP